MLCKKPFYSFGCGQCLPCRVKHRRVWAHRILLEAMTHEKSSFVTLTYKNEPPGGTLVPRDSQLWLKRLRKSLRTNGQPAIRFYLVGEYGDQTGRPHYHAALFGCGVEMLPLINQSWGLGHVKVGSLTLASANYIAGYVTKKMTSEDDERLGGRYPEFARMSKGIGRDLVPEIVKALGVRKNEIKTISDVPYVLFHGVRSLPIGRYLRNRLIPELGLPDKNGRLIERARYATLQEADAAQAHYEKMQRLFADYVDYPPGTPRHKILEMIHAQIATETAQRIKNLESRFSRKESKNAKTL